MAETNPIAPDMKRGTVGEVAAYFVRLGLLAFGGAAGHVAMMRRELVQRKKWISEQEFLDLFGIMNLIPGPSSTETVIALGYWRAGWPALILAGVLFIAPAMLMVLGLSWAYVRYGALPAAQWILYGLNPIVIAIITDALWSLGRVALKSIWLAALCTAAIVLYFRGVSIVAILFGAILLILVVGVAGKRGKNTVAAGFAPTALVAGAAGAAAAIPFTLSRLFLTFLKIGAVSYGSGYVLLAFLRADFVAHLHWMTDKQLLDSIAIGQMTPGPVFTSATFIGYLTGGVKGALLATLGIFLPSFVYVVIIFPLYPRLKGSAGARIFLDGINATTVGLMGAVSWQLARGAIVDWFTAAESLAAFLILRRFQINSAWLILGGMAVGFAFRFAVH
ncbi:MAG TPA: chromate efflux transporter [Candidatus Limnocylindrales bacterium]|nr:chromate efflux transporter [Candidatus Limnocylindrales bacterium]